MKNDWLTYGIIGTTTSSIGTLLSTTDLQAIISIIVTVLGFIISVIIPLIIKLIKKIKDAKADGKITIDEAEDIASTGKEIIDATQNFIDEQNKNKEEKK